MEISDKKIEALAHLARLEFDATAKPKIKADLEQILTFCNQLNELDTSDVKPLIYMSDRHEHLREDIVKPSLEKSKALGNAPDADSDYFRVPKVIKKD